ncbi:MAG: DUF4922 domain-containing protein [Ignavibacteriaceae bacterium]|nr:DUF4922 domain-containing protein [Ignavibacteriaceae bacterium]
MTEYSARAKEMLARQKIDWDWCEKGYKSLETVITHNFLIGGFSLKAQFNPGRFVSTTAKVDPKSIKERKCFLCLEQLPPAQERLKYRNGFQILVNPFPIFPEHFTVPKTAHEPQKIEGNFEDMLMLAEDLGEDFTVFYNGPKCGASAPDHFHFQAGTRGFMTIEGDFEALRIEFSIAGREVGGGDAGSEAKVGESTYGVRVNGAGGKAKAGTGDKRLTVNAVDDGVRKMLFLEGADKASLASGFYKLLEKFRVLTDTPAGEEPLLNVILWKTGNVFRCVIFLRAKHRPARYFAEGADRILLSPASVDVGGVGIVPVEEDFNRLTPEALQEMFTEVFISRELLARLL